MTGPTSRVPTPREFEAILAHFINATLLGGGTAVGPDARLFEDGYINSLRILDLIAMIEKTLGRRIPDRAVRLSNFRTIATIVRAFHPDAPSGASVEDERHFERPRDRSQFASPVPALVERGDLTVMGAGRVALSGLALDVLGAVDRTVTRWARGLGAPDHHYPSLISARVLERAGQPTGGASPRARNDTAARDDSAVLSPAVCYHAYPELSGQTVGPVPTLLTARGHCYRHEDGNYVPLERLWEFTMREIIVMGTREQVEDARQSLVRQVIALVETLDLDGTIETASDPFFTAGDEARRLMQQAGALKYELRLTVDPAGRAIAAASFNHHHDFFGTRFAIRLTNGGPAHTGCVAFGLERWVLALLAQHGTEPHAWPNAARTWLDESRRHAHGAGA